MNTSITSEEAILKACRQLVSEKGLAAVNMRAVAQACGVALGSLYYYFPSKNDLLIATIESVWADIFQLSDTNVDHLSFPEYMAYCFKQILLGIKKYPNFFTIHSISVSTDNQPKARDAMARSLRQMTEKMLTALRADQNVHQNAFSETFTETDFVDFVLSNMVCLLVQKKENCELLIEVIRRTIYLT